MAITLDGCRAKLDWAEKHLNAASDQAAEFFERDAYEFVAHFNEVDESYSVVFKEREKIPGEWGLILGDFLHNARGALDHLVQQLVLLADAAPHSRHQFPIVDEPADWVRVVEHPPQRGRQGQLDFIDPSHVALIKSLQPNEPATGLPRLRFLRDFSNADKHRLIHVARTTLTQAPTVTTFRAVPAHLTRVQYPEPGTPIEHGAEVARVWVSDDIRIIPRGDRFELVGQEMNVDAQFSAAAIFGVPGSEWVRARVFREALSDVRDIVERFAAFFP